MALVLKDRVRQVTTTTGTGTITLSGSVNGFQTFADVLSDADTTYYVINDSTSGDFEVGLGTFTASGTTLSRDTILESSNSGSAVNFGAGQKEVFITYPAEKAVFQDGSDNVTLPADLTVDTNTLYVDSSNDRVGIGTSSPDTTLHVNSAGTNLNSTFESTDLSLEVAFKDSNQESRFIVTNGETRISVDQNDEDANSYFTVRIDNSEKMRIDSNGDVGIGTTSPDGKLHIDGCSDTVTGLVLEAAVPGDCRFIDVHNSDGNKRIGFSYDNSNIKLNITDRSENKLVTVEELTGNVGINTSSPSEKLEVAGNILLEDSELIFNSNAGAIAKIDNNSGDLRLHADSSILFFESDADVVKGRVDVNNGRIRIGDDAVPSEALEVVGNVVPSADATHDLGTPSLSWNNIYTNDLHLSNMKHDKGNDVDGTKGTWTIQEGEDDLFIINNRNGKKYKFALEEIE